MGHAGSPLTRPPTEAASRPRPGIPPPTSGELTESTTVVLAPAPNTTLDSGRVFFACRRQVEAQGPPLALSSHCGTSV